MNKNLLDRLLEIKQWIGLGLAIVTSIVAASGWVVTYFAKKAELEFVSCKADVNVRIARGTSSIQLVQERQIQLKRELREARQSATGTGTTLLNTDSDHLTVEEIRAAIRTTKENLKVLSDDISFFVNSLARKECDSKEGRNKLWDKLSTDPPIKEN